MCVIADGKRRAVHRRHHGRRGHRLHGSDDERLHRSRLVRSRARGGYGPQARHPFGCTLSLRARRRSGIHRAGSGTRDQTHSRILRRRGLRTRDCRQSAGMAARYRFLAGARRSAWPVSTCRSAKSSAFWKVSASSLSATSRWTWRHHPGAATFTVQPIWSKKSCASTASTKCPRFPCGVRMPWRGPCSRLSRRSVASCGARWPRGASAKRSPIPSSRAHRRNSSAAAMTRGSWKTPSRPISMRCGRACCRRCWRPPRAISRAASADFHLFEVGAQFESGMPGAQTNVAAGIRVGSGVAHWTKATHRRRRVRRQSRHDRARRSSLGRTDDGAGQDRRAGLVSSRPLRHAGARPEGAGLFRRTASERAGSFRHQGAGRRLRSVSWTRSPSRSRRAKRAQLFAPSPYPAVERDFAFVLDAKVAADDVVKAVRNTERC